MVLTPETSSSDLWVTGDVPNAVDSGKAATLSYAVGQAKGDINFATFAIDDYSVDKQAFRACHARARVRRRAVPADLFAPSVCQGHVDLQPRHRRAGVRRPDRPRAQLGLGRPQRARPRRRGRLAAEPDL
jgi:hypothetical protein